MPRRPFVTEVYVPADSTPARGELHPWTRRFHSEANTGTCSRPQLTTFSLSPAGLLSPEAFCFP